MPARSHGHRAGGRRTPTYNSWRAMCERCRYPRHPFYPSYGGRGITVCERWTGRGGFQRFVADMGTRPAGMTLDRINPDGDYEPGNCRWATPREQRWTRRDMIAGDRHNWISDRALERAGTRPAMPF